MEASQDSVSSPTAEPRSECRSCLADEAPHAARPPPRLHAHRATRLSQDQPEGSHRPRAGHPSSKLCGPRAGVLAHASSALVLLPTLGCRVSWRGLGSGAPASAPGHQRSASCSSLERNGRWVAQQEAGCRGSWDLARPGCSGKLPWAQSGWPTVRAGLPQAVSRPHATVDADVAETCLFVALPVPPETRWKHMPEGPPGPGQGGQENLP